jgi:hypothetical protein
LPQRRRSTPHSKLGTQQPQSIGGLIVKFVASASLRSHLEMQHNIFWSFVLNQDLAPERAAAVYPATELPATGIYLCLVPQCGGHSGTRFNLCRHFLMQHPQDLVCIPIEGSLPLPKCTRCGLQMPVEDLS